MLQLQSRAVGWSKGKVRASSGLLYAAFASASCKYQISFGVVIPNEEMNTGELGNYKNLVK